MYVALGAKRKELCERGAAGLFESSSLDVPPEQPCSRVVCAHFSLLAPSFRTCHRNDYEGFGRLRNANTARGDASRSLDGAASDGPVHPPVWGGCELPGGHGR